MESDFLAELAKALHIGDRELKEALAKGADVNATRGYPAGNTPLHSAVRAGRKDIVELLIAKGEGVNAKNNDGQTPVDVAISRRRKEIVELLIAKGADVSLHVAARFGALTKIESLIEKGTNIREKDASGQTALHYAPSDIRQRLSYTPFIVCSCEAGRIALKHTVKKF